MADDSNKSLNITYEQLQQLMASVAHKPDPLTQKKIDQEIAKEKRRARLALDLGYAEEMQRWNHQNACGHSRHAGKGHDVPRGAFNSEWTTNGQLHGSGRDETIGLICMRCGTTWQFRPTDAELDKARNGDLAGMAPPPIERCVNKDQFLREKPKPPRLETEGVEVVR